MSSISRGKQRRYKGKHHNKKGRGNGRRIKKNRNKIIKLNSTKRHSQQQEIFKSFNLKNLHENVEQELTKNLENEIIKSRLVNLLTYSNTEQSKVDDNKQDIKRINVSSTPDIVLVENFELGDLSCMKGKFIPAPLVSHALIKYVK